MTNNPLKVRFPDGSIREYKDIVEPDFHRIFAQCAPYTLTAQSGAHVPYTLYKAIEYVVKSGIQGEVVECGVWAGGSMLLAALSLLVFKDSSRNLYLYDTFEGMPEPSEIDVDWDGNPTWPAWKQRRDEGSSWGFGGTVEQVKNVMSKSGYPSDHIIYVKGMVENTIPKIAPQHIALLRLDTDLYESTIHELKHLFPRLARGGVLIIDDYGYFRGARAATDQFLASIENKLYLARVDDTVRVAVKIFD